MTAKVVLEVAEAQSGSAEVLDAAVDGLDGPLEARNRRGSRGDASRVIGRVARAREFDGANRPGLRGDAEGVPVRGVSAVQPVSLRGPASTCSRRRGCGRTWRWSTPSAGGYGRLLWDSSHSATIAPTPR